MFILIVYLIYVSLFKGYIPYLPNIPIYSNTEVNVVKKIISKRTKKILIFFI